jgi:hypothetical protein
MKKIFFVLLTVFMITLSFADTFENDVGDKYKIENTQNLDVMTATLNVVEIPLFSNQLLRDEISNDFILLCNDSGEEEIVGCMILKLPDIDRIQNHYKNRTYRNYKTRTAGGLPYVC